MSERMISRGARYEQVRPQPRFWFLKVLAVLFGVAGVGSLLGWLSQVERLGVVSVAAGVGSAIVGLGIATALWALFWLTEAVEELKARER